MFRRIGHRLGETLFRRVLSPSRRDAAPMDSFNVSERHCSGLCILLAETGVLACDIRIDAHAVACLECRIQILDLLIASESLVILLLFVIHVSFLEKYTGSDLGILVSFLDGFLEIFDSLVIFLKVDIAVARQSESVCRKHRLGSRELLKIFYRLLIIALIVIRLGRTESGKIAGICIAVFVCDLLIFGSGYRVIALCLDLYLIVSLERLVEMRIAIDEKVTEHKCRHNCQTADYPENHFLVFRDFLAGLTEVCV